MEHNYLGNGFESGTEPTRRVGTSESPIIGNEIIFSDSSGQQLISHKLKGGLSPAELTIHHQHGAVTIILTDRELVMIHKFGERGNTTNCRYIPNDDGSYTLASIETGFDDESAADAVEGAFTDAFRDAGLLGFDDIAIASEDELASMLRVIDNGLRMPEKPANTIKVTQEVSAQNGQAADLTQYQVELFTNKQANGSARINVGEESQITFNPEGEVAEEVTVGVEFIDFEGASGLPYLVIRKQKADGKVIVRYVPTRIPSNPNLNRTLMEEGSENSAPNYFAPYAEFAKNIPQPFFIKT